MASAWSGVAAADKPSFAKIAAAGLKTSTSQPKSETLPGVLRKNTVTSPPRDRMVNASGGAHIPTSTAPATQLSVSKSSLSVRDSNNVARPEVHVQSVDALSPVGRPATAETGMLAPASSEDSTTQVSSSSGSVKPPSSDGKSVASGTTFALDEKDSLRPDDSASVQAVEEEETFGSTTVANVGTGADPVDEARAFSDQLREISSMEPSQLAMPISPYGVSVNVSPRVLYDPGEPRKVNGNMMASDMASAPDYQNDLPPDPKLLEALESPRDRVIVVKLETDIRDFINDVSESTINLPQFNAYHRMLAHKAAEYYMLGHLVDDTASGVRLFKTSRTCLRPLLSGIATPPTASSTPPPGAPPMRILRRGVDAPAIVNGSNLPSKSTSEDGDDATDDSKASKKPLSRQEREARYEAARLRILGPDTKASESPENTNTVDTSRSSSATGRKSKAKKRADSDDDFEARSAYSAFFTTPYSGDGSAGNTYGYPGYIGGNPAHSFPMYAPNQVSQSISPPYILPVAGGMPWNQPSYLNGSGPPPWPRPTQPGYDLTGEFQRSMSFETAMQQPISSQPAFSTPYQQSYYAPMQSMTQPPYAGQNFGVAAASSIVHSGFGPRSMSSQGPSSDSQPYAFGQLPSQTIPGRPPSKLEHPLPGSYRGKHFNPQSQTFVPGQPNISTGRSFSPQTATNPAFGGAHLMPSHSQSASVSSSSPRPPSGPSPMPAQPMTHPLPPPVFPLQPTPNQPLPPKPGSVAYRPTTTQTTASAATVNGQSHSSIAKWNAPASLPAKPPPPQGHGDRFPQVQRQPSYGTPGGAQTSGRGMLSFGSMQPNGLDPHGATADAR